VAWFDERGTGIVFADCFYSLEKRKTLVVILFFRFSQDLEEVVNREVSERVGVQVVPGKIDVAVRESLVCRRS